MKQGLESNAVRLAIAIDDPRIVEIYNLHEDGEIPMTLARYRTEYTAMAAENRVERYVAIQNDRVTGVGSFHWAWWTGQPGIYTMDVRVDPQYSRQGIGTSLLDLMRSELAFRGATRLVRWMRANAAEGFRFAARRGFHETGKVLQEYYLPVARADTRAYAGIKARLLAEGVRIASLAELACTDELFLRALHRLWADSDQEEPASDQPPGFFVSWQKQVLDAPGLTPETHWIALDGGVPVGMTFLKRLSDSAFENDYTGVASTHRRRGIATALKMCAISWAQQQSAEWFYTSSEIGNHAMITINKQLGYRSGAQQREIAYNLP